MTVKVFGSQVLEVKNLNDSVKSLKLSVPNGFEFTPGQYLSLSMDIEGKKIRIPYSIASIPNRKKFIEFCIKINKGSKSSEYISSLKKDDEIELFGPGGKFVVDKISKKRDLVFISTGTGIAPFRSMITQLLKKGFGNQILLLKGFRNEEEVLFDNDFNELRKRYKNFGFYNILSKPKDKKYENKGYVQDFIDKFISKDFDGDFYLCGLNVMIESVKDILIKRGISERKIFYEKY